MLILIEISETLVSGLHLDITQKFRQKPELSIYNRGAGRSNDHSDSIWLMRVVSVGYKESNFCDDASFLYIAGFYFLHLDCPHH